MKTHERYLAIGAMVSMLFIFGVLVGYGYGASIFISPIGNMNTFSEPPLLPDGWFVYRADAWSVGYAPDDVVTEKEGGVVVFAPEDAAEGKVYFEVEPQKNTLSEIKIARSVDEACPEPVNVMIAHYPGLKYTLGNGHTEFFIEHSRGVYLLSSDDFESPDIGAMFVTFSFTE